MQKNFKVIHLLGKLLIVTILFGGCDCTNKDKNNPTEEQILTADLKKLIKKDQEAVLDEKIKELKEQAKDNPEALNGAIENYKQIQNKLAKKEVLTTEEVESISFLKDALKDGNQLKSAAGKLANLLENIKSNNNTSNPIADGKASHKQSLQKETDILKKMEPMLQSPDNFAAWLRSIKKSKKANNQLADYIQTLDIISNYFQTSNQANFVFTMVIENELEEIPGNFPLKKEKELKILYSLRDIKKYAKPDLDLEGFKTHLSYMVEFLKA